MRESLRVQLEDTFKSGKSSNIKQIAHLSSAILWTDSTVKALVENSIQGLLLVYSARLDELRKQVRTSKEYSSPLAIQTVNSALVLQLLHQRDILQRLMLQNVSELTNFIWQCSIRNYLGKGDCTVQLMTLTRKYCFEYLGMQERICLTPTTDRCLMSLAHSLESAQIGCLHGSGDSGKTSTVG